MIRGVALAVFRAEFDGVAVLLAPLDQPALEVGLRFGQLFEVLVVVEDVVDQQPVDEFVSAVEIDRPHHRLERIAEDVLLSGISRSRADDVPVEADLYGQCVERLARHHLRPQLRHEAFVAVGEFDEQVVRSDGLDDGVAQKFQALVVDLLAVVQNQRS